MDNNKVFKVLFKGTILPGFDKQTVIENVFKITRIPKETITRKFFSGKTVVIRHADSQEYASRLQKTFAQAGIETYIEEISETDSNDEVNGLETKETLQWEEQPIETEESDKKASVLLKKPKMIAIASLVLLFITGYLIFYTSPPAETVSQSEPDKKATAKNNQPEPSYRLDSSQVKQLIKITDQEELPRLIRFAPLMGINPEIINVLTQIKGFNNNISTSNPLYLFATPNHSGVLFSSQYLADSNYREPIEKQLAKLVNQDPCAIYKTMAMHTSGQAVLISSIARPAKGNNQYSGLTRQLGQLNKQFDALLPASVDSEITTFYFIYQLPASDNTEALASTVNKPHQSNAFFIAASGKKYWLQPLQAFSSINTELLSHLRIEPLKLQTLSSLPVASLLDLSLMLIPKSKSQVNAKPNFKPEHAISVKPSFSFKDINDYNPALDIEFVPQWFSGPFAMVTNNFHFDEQLNIELLAKGQNIDNLMEYSHMAKIVVHSVNNNKGVNILSQSCKDSDDSYFRDYDGLQEAFINDDFTSYRATTALKTISIAPGNHIEDIENIVGAITLNLPLAIQDKTLSLPDRVSVQKFKQFSVLLQTIDEHAIDYRIIGNRDYFLTLRAYNKAGAILQPTELTRHQQNNGLNHFYRQSFSEPVHSVKIFHTSQQKRMTYSFTLKPRIIPPASPILPEEAELLVFTDSELAETQLADDLLRDNPEWLGRNIANRQSGPFYISLFSQAEKTEPGADNTLVRSPGDNIEVGSRDGAITIKTVNNRFIKQNLTAVKVKLLQDKKPLVKDFVTFTEKELFSDDNPDITSVPQTYINANTAIEFDENKTSDIHGLVKLSLPTGFKSHSSQFLSPGQSIKLGSLLIRPVKITRQQVQFNITGNIEQLVQVKLYNKSKQLISQALELKQLSENEASLTLLYYDYIDTIKLLLAEKALIKEYPIAFTLPSED